MARRTKNSVELICFVGEPIELKTGRSGNSYARFSVATTEVWGTGDQRQERTEWTTVTAFGKTAENLAKYGRKGGYLQIEGSLRTDKYQVEGESKPRYSTYVVVEEFILLDKPEGGAPAGDPPAKDPNSDDIPF
ncbi:single-stranded DNA-binding protein [Pseudoxanthomonas kaohsiungensis]|uniref:Single-stranded DNA-binding protein n=1 Tax=Pseudoxanthomonas kaohsiungensis TaxID=283923 RepID=A0ABW3M027_9GAMM|nr:single-stranded DNA-binding protein [Pseudoxanthomonas kaohsiungensis]KAF1702833.1 hypothetical protein CSC66_08655 [Pseudoxanthomonas kaohsiungensis]